MNLVRPVPLAALLSAAVLPALATQAATSQQPDRARSSVERGRYLMQTAGCNDCHTAGYTQAAGKVAESDWLTGDTLGWNGPWGTTYPTNLCLSSGTLKPHANACMMRTSLLPRTACHGLDSP